MSKINKIPEVELTVRELEVVRKGKEEFENGELFSCENVGELRRELASEREADGILNKEAFQYVIDNYDETLRNLTEKECK